MPSGYHAPPIVTTILLGVTKTPPIFLSTGPLGARYVSTFNVSPQSEVKARTLLIRNPRAPARNLPLQGRDLDAARVTALWTGPKF